VIAIPRQDAASLIFGALASSGFHMAITLDDTPLPYLIAPDLGIAAIVPLVAVAVILATRAVGAAIQWATHAR
jgi:hypothetical protein